MEFNQPKGIYQQIADQICDRILEKHWLPGQRIPSIRELAVDLGVNPNTVTRSYKMLLDEMIIDNQRGVGFFVGDEAIAIILSKKRQEFLSEELPKLFKVMQQLNISAEEINQRFNAYEQEAI